MLLPTTGYRDKNWAICLNTQLQKCRKEQTVITIKEGGGIPNFAIWERASVHTHLTDIRRPLRVADKYRCCSSNPHRLAILIPATHIWIEVVCFALDAQRLLSCLFFAERENLTDFHFQLLPTLVQVIREKHSECLPSHALHIHQATLHS